MNLGLFHLPFWRGRKGSPLDRAETFILCYLWKHFFHLFSLCFFLFLFGRPRKLFKRELCKTFIFSTFNFACTVRATQLFCNPSVVGNHFSPCSESTEKQITGTYKMILSIQSIVQVIILVVTLELILILTVTLLSKETEYQNQESNMHHFKWSNFINSQCHKLKQEEGWNRKFKPLNHPASQIL